jgi:hypothetical protein
VRIRDDLDRGSSRGGWGRLALLCVLFLACLNPRPEELPSQNALEAPPAEPAPVDFAAPAAAGATGPADLAPSGVPESFPEEDDSGPDQARQGRPPADAGVEADAGTDAGTD